MFQEKKQEVQTAILRVDQLSQQLEDLKKGKLNGFQSYNGKLTGPAAVELKRLYQELQVIAWVWGFGLTQWEQNIQISVFNISISLAWRDASELLST